MSHLILVAVLSYWNAGEMIALRSWVDLPQFLEVHVNYQPALEADLEEA